MKPFVDLSLLPELCPALGSAFPTGDSHVGPQLPTACQALNVLKAVMLMAHLPKSEVRMPTAEQCLPCQEQELSASQQLLRNILLEDAGLRAANEAGTLQVTSKGKGS